MLSVSTASDPTQVTVVFSEAVAQASAEDAANYAIDNAVLVSGALLGADLETVTLITSPLSGGTTYTLTVNNVRDRAVVPNVILPESQASFSLDPTDLTLLGYWSFDEGAGSIAGDSSSYDNHGTLVNDATWVQGEVGGALDFDGADDYVEIADNAELDLTGGQLTIAAWIYPRTFGQGLDGRIVDKGGGSGGSNGWMFRVGGFKNQNNLKYETNNTTSGSSNTNVITLGTWQHVAVVQDGGAVAPNRS